MGPRFDAYAKQMGERAGELERAAKARDGKATVELAGQIQQVCTACHDKFR
jgi:cytochrome c556